MSPIIAAALITGILSALIALGAQIWRRPHYWIWILPAAVAIGFQLGILKGIWAWESFLYDIPWGSVGLLLAWTGLSRAGFLRVRSWGMVVVASALVGDLCVATGLALSEPDSARRARLVVAASGASLIGWTSGAATLLLGPASQEIRLLGLGLALLGLVRGASSVADGSTSEGSISAGSTSAGSASAGGTPVGKGLFGRPAFKELGLAIPVALAAAVAAWLLAAGGALEFVADGLEMLPIIMPHQATSTVALAGLIGGMVGDEGVMALLSREILARGLGLDGPWAADAFRLGLAVGGGLPLLVASGSRLATGVPLWLLQVIAVLLWATLRG